MRTPQIDTASDRAVSQPRATGRRAVGAAAAVVVGIVVWIVAEPIFGIDLTAEIGGEPTPVGVVDIAIASLISGLAGWGLLAVLERTTRRPGITWTIIAAAVLAISLAAPLTLATSTAAALTLTAVHLAVGTTVIVSTGPTVRRSGGTTAQA